jgi:hypothetical protein
MWWNIFLCKNIGETFWLENIEKLGMTILVAKTLKCGQTFWCKNIEKHLGGHFGLKILKKIMEEHFGVKKLKNTYLAIFLSLKTL